MTDIVFFGIQGSGKGTQARKLQAVLKDSYYFEMGKVFRDYINSGAPEAEDLKRRINQGYLATDEEVMKLFFSKMREIKSQNDDKLPEVFVFDGIPRKLGQKEAFDEWESKNNRDFIAVNIQISEQESLKRLLQRKTCSICGKPFPADYKNDTCDSCGGEITIRADETEEAIKKRIKEFKENTLPVIEEYKKEGKLIQVNGEQNPEEVFSDIVTNIKKQINI